MIEIIKNTPASIVFICVLILVSHVSRAEIYQWKDADGRIHFGDKPQVENATSVEIKEKTLSEREKQDMDARRKKQEQMLEILEQGRLERAYEQQQKELYIQLTEANCDKKKKYQRDAYNAPHLYEIDEDGKKHILSREEAVEHLSEVESYIKENC